MEHIVVSGMLLLCRMGCCAVSEMCRMEYIVVSGMLLCRMECCAFNRMMVLLQDGMLCFQLDDDDVVHDGMLCIQLDDDDVVQDGMLCFQLDDDDVVQDGMLCCHAGAMCVQAINGIHGLQDGQ